MENQEQQHPLHNRDRETVNTLLAGEPTDFHLAELARLLIRYQGFPGAKDIQSDLQKAMERWGFTEATLYEKTRQIHNSQPVYKGRANKGEAEDWN